MKTGNILIIVGLLAIGIAAVWFFFLRKKEYKINSFNLETKVANVTANGKTYDVKAGQGFVDGNLSISVEPNEAGKFVKVSFKDGGNKVDQIFRF